MAHQSFNNIPPTATWQSTGSLAPPYKSFDNSVASNQYYPQSSRSQLKVSPNVEIPPLVAEFVGTFLLVFTVGCNVLSNNSVWGGVSIASVLMVMIYAFGKISGGNFNPAVSIALGIADTMGCEKGKPWKEVGVFCVVQVVAGILAGFFYRALFDHAFRLAPMTGHGWISASACELLYTFVLCFVVLNVGVQAANFYYGLAIGFVVIAGAYGAGAISGGCFNPAVAIGIDVIGGANWRIGWSMFYTVAELLGAALAAGLLFCVRPEKFKRLANPLRSMLVSEFLGTFVLVLTVGLNVLGSSRAGAFSIAASLMCMIYALWDVSGAHFNPAVTVAIFCWKKFQKLPMEPRENKKAVQYILAQIFGGVLAGCVYSFLHQRRSFPLGPGEAYGWTHIAVAEIIFTAVLCLVVISVAVYSSIPDFFGLAIGSCITVGGFAIGSVSGGSLNPAVSLGIAASQFWNPAVTYRYLVQQFAIACAYSIFEFIGAILAAGALAIVLKPNDLKAMLIAEFIGTFLLVFTIGCNILTNTQSAWIGVSIASVLMVMIYAFGKISGAHFNPAVSLTQGIVNHISRKTGARELGMNWRSVAHYVGVQIAAGILAGFTYRYLFGNAFNLAPAKGFSWISAGMCELWYTFMLCFVVLNVCFPTPTSYSGLAIGFVVVAGAYGAGVVSGGCFNPAVAIGIDVIGGYNWSIGWAMIYIIFEIVGAALAAGLFFVVRREYFSPASNSTRLSTLTSEFIGTFMLVLTVGLNVLAQSPAAAFSIAASLMCMIYALGDVSGAHFNPAVTLAILLSESRPQDKIKDYAQFMIVQIVAGIVAGFTYMNIYQGKSFPLGPANGFGWAEVALAEFVFTFVLCLVVLCVAVKSPTKDGPRGMGIAPMFGLAIGSCVTVGGLAIGKISGGSLNPAVSFGIGTSQYRHMAGMTTAAIYTFFEMLGAVAAAAIVRVTHPAVPLLPVPKNQSYASGSGSIPTTQPLGSGSIPTMSPPSAPHTAGAIGSGSIPTTSPPYAPYTSGGMGSGSFPNGQMGMGSHSMSGSTFPTMPPPSGQHTSGGMFGSGAFPDAVAPTITSVPFR